MALDQFSENILAVDDLISSHINKVPGSGLGETEGVTGDKLDYLELPMSDKELLTLRDEWEKQYAPYETKIKPIFERNLRSYLGRNMKSGALLESDMPGAANLQFESEETFLPAATAQDPSPYVFSDDTPEGNRLSQDVQTMLQFHAQQLLIRRKMAMMTRQWSIYHLGVMKAGWNKFEVNGEEKGDVAIDNRKIQDFIFDPNGFVDVYGDFSSWLGERIYISALKLIDMFPHEKEYITNQVGGQDKLGTEVCYTEWWNDDYCFSTFKEVVLDKHKNEFFNYTEDEPETDDLLGKTPQKRNHFAAPKKPYIFLSVFSLQERPHDITGLIEQNIPNQAKISKRTEQIDANVSQSNNGLAFSENNFNQETAKQAANALTFGVGKVLVPQGGPIAEAIVRLAAPELPDSAFKDMENSENHLRSSWGTQGIASQEQKPNETAKGEMLNQSRDTSRIGGGIGDILEQSVSKGVFDWLVQLYHVFYDVKHFGAVMGTGKATEYVQLSSQDFNRQLIVGVTANSMKPRDQISEMNQATQFFQMGAIGPKTLLDASDFPDADAAAGDGALYKMSMETDGGKTYIQLNFPELWASIQQMLQQQQAEAQQAQQQQLQMEGAQGQQQLQQKAQAGQQQLQQGQAQHEQKLKQEQKSHQQKLQIQKEQAAVKPKE